MSKNIHYATVANCDHDRNVRSGHLHHLWRGTPPTLLYAPVPSYLVNFDHGLAPTDDQVHSYAIEEGLTSLMYEYVGLAVSGLFSLFSSPYFKFFNVDRKNHYE